MCVRVYRCACAFGLLIVCINRFLPPPGDWLSEYGLVDHHQVRMTLRHPNHLDFQLPAMSCEVDVWESLYRKEKKRVLQKGHFETIISSHLNSEVSRGNYINSAAVESASSDRDAAGAPPSPDCGEEGRASPESLRAIHSPPPSDDGLKPNDEHAADTTHANHVDVDEQLDRMTVVKQGQVSANRRSTIDFSGKCIRILTSLLYNTLSPCAGHLSPGISSERKGGV